MLIELSITELATQPGKLSPTVITVQTHRPEKAKAVTRAEKKSPLPKVRTLKDN